MDRNTRPLIEGGLTMGIKVIQCVRSGLVSSITLLCLVSCASSPRLGTSITDLETSHLIVRDRTGQLTHEQVREVADRADKALKEILIFWSEDPKINELGKIRVELERPRGRGEFYGSVFKWGLEGGNKIRIVYVFGVDREPQGMVHKLTHAIFPNDDKLIRNMMGIPMEVLFGNRLTFPMCGFNNSTWVLALRRLKISIPLAKMGPEHESWGMTTQAGLPTFTNRRIQHIAYAEAGSFGLYLLDAYGVDKIKEFYRLSLQGKRPWKDALGLTLEELEANWVRSLDSIQERDQDISELMKLFRRSQDRACFDAQDLAIKAQESR